jgi:aspartate racemase
MRTIGLIGGMSWESTAQYYRIINAAVRQRLGGLHSAELLLYSVDFGVLERLQHEGRWDEAGSLLAEAACRLQLAGAECLVLCTNTMHKVAPQIEIATNLPLLHIADPTGTEAARLGVRSVGLLATQFTMEQSFYRERLEQVHGLTVLTPEVTDRAKIHRIIYDELCAGRLEESSREYYRSVVHQLAARGAQAIVLGCTEIMLLLGPSDCAVPLIDTTSLHALAAVDFALSDVCVNND